MHNNLEYPLVSVVLPAYNAQEYILEAVESILEQTFSDFELIIINDGSVDETFNILETIKAKDPRVRVYHRENQGLVKSLNFAINESRGKYIARMDADDISLPTRLEKQVDVLELNRNIDVVGCDYFTIDSRGYRKKLVELPKSSSDILLALTYSVPVAHPSVMIRKEIFERYLYQESYVEDYLLWANIFAVDNFYNLEEPLFEYRHNYGSSFSDTKRLRMMKEEASVSKNYIEKNLSEIYAGILERENKAKSISGKAIFAIFSRYSRMDAIGLLMKKPVVTPFFFYHFVRHYLRVLYRLISLKNNV